MNRRQDHHLRSSITKIQSKIKDIRDRATLHGLMLNEMLGLTQSTFGFVIEIDPISRFHKSFEVLTQHASSNEVPPSFYKRIQLDLDLFTPVFSSLQTAAYDQKQLENFPIEKLQAPTLMQMVTIPLVDNQNLYGLLCLANSPIPYSSSITKRCWPLLTNVFCIRRKIIAQGSQDLDQSSAHQLNTLSTENPLELLSRLELICPLGIIVINQNLEIIRLNPIAEKLIGENKRHAVGQNIKTYIPERFPNEHRLHTFTLHRQRNLTYAQHAKFMVLRADNSTVPIELSFAPYLANDRTHFFLMLQDLSELEKIKIEQQAQVQKFKAVSDLAPIGIMQTNLNWECIYANNRWCEICCMDIDEVRDRGWVDVFYNEDVDRVLKELYQAINNEKEFKTECRLRTRFGEIIWVEFHAQAILGPKGKVDGLIATIADITYRRQAEVKLRNMAELDPLTGLANRTLFHDRLQRALLRIDRHGAVALLCLDLDGFKTVNDSLGHDAGDLLLKTIAERLRGVLRYEDTVARVGGDEFMIIVESVESATVVSAISEKILRSLELPIFIESQEVFITASIGISFCIDSHESDSKTLMKQGDIALYRAKSEGRNNYQYYSPELEMASRERLTLTNSLHRALERNEFTMFYQLQTDVRTQKVVGAEALIRWQHPQRGLVSPTEFIPLLEDTGLIIPVGNWLVEESIVTFKKWIDKGILAEDCHISVNLSAKQLRDIRLISVFERVIDQTGINGSCIVVEITESALIEESLATKEILSKLKALGIKVALDDFGTGYSSLTYLKRFPIDFIKIDRGFVRDILTDPEDSAIIQAVIALANSLNLGTIAEGVDSQEKLALLENWGCFYHQGFFINKPTNAIHTETLIREKLSANLVPAEFTGLKH